MEHRTIKITIISSLVGLGLAIAGFLIAAGELRQATSDSKESSKEMLETVKTSTVRLYNIEKNQEIKAIIDSVFKKTTNEKLDIALLKLDNLQTRMTRMEWLHRMPPNGADKIEPFPKGNSYRLHSERMKQ